ncbi:type II toxin-antitoxin system HicA family toxin [Kribbella sp. NBC_00482]|uniref:type II toxin-antitoxin system HicA family toxin n=1 Tax=Kribbella sp. NBC_00482 TaxID=2975968 RepID=UPI002E195C72
MAKKKRDAEAELRAAGYSPVPGKKRGHGDHVIWQRGKRTVSVPKHAEIKTGTWDGIQKQAGLNGKGEPDRQPSEQQKAMDLIQGGSPAPGSGGASGSGQREQPVTQRHGKKRGRGRG